MNPFLEFGFSVACHKRRWESKSHIHPNTISRIEHGKHNIRLTQIGQLAKALKVTPAKLCRSI